MDGLLNGEWIKTDPKDVDDGCPPDHKRFEVHKFYARHDREWQRRLRQEEGIWGI